MTTPHDQSPDEGHVPHGSDTGWPTDEAAAPDATGGGPPPPPPWDEAVDAGGPVADEPAVQDEKLEDEPATVEEGQPVEEHSGEPDPEPDLDSEPGPEPEPYGEPDPEPYGEPDPASSTDREPVEDQLPVDAQVLEPGHDGFDVATDVRPVSTDELPAGLPSEIVVPELDQTEDVDGTAAPNPQERPRRLTAAVLALLVTTLAMAVAAGLVWYQARQHDATEKARRAGLESSRDAARLLFSYDYRTLTKDFEAGKAITTGAFRKQYADTTTRLVTPVATEKKAVVKAEVVTAGVVRATPDLVVTIVYVNQVTTSSLTTGPKVDLSRVRMTLQRVNGRWLVSKVDAL